MLAVLTTGATAFERGLFQDDAQVLFRIFIAEGGFWHQATLLITSPTRRLQSSPYAAALLTSDPLLFLRISSEGLLLAIGAVAAALARFTLHAGRATAFLAGALTITASSDWMTASMISLGYNLAILLHLLGALALVRWTAGGRMAWLALALLSGTASLWTIDAAATVHPFTPLLAGVVCDGPAARRRLAWGTALWWLCAAPYYGSFLVFLLDSGGYAAQAVGPSSWPDRGRRLIDLVSYNVTPWGWAFARPQWFPAPPLSVSWPARFAFSTLGLAVATVAYLRLRAIDQRSSPRAALDQRRLGLTMAVLVWFTVLANATFMAVHLSEIYYRTHLLSRVWASLAVAATTGAVVHRGALGLVSGLSVAGAVLALGILGGQERQDYFRGYWQRHQRELGSIADALSGLAQEAQVVLRRPSHALYTATEAPYLARAWTTLLVADPSVECRTFLASPDRGTSCTPEPGALVCRGDRSPRCGSGASADHRIPYDQLIVLTYDPAAAQYRVETMLPHEFTPAALAGERASGEYSPARHLGERRVSRLAASLLDRR